MPSSPPEGTASLHTGSTERVVSDPQGVKPPYGASGVGNAYEYNQGYQVGSGDRLNVRVFGQTDLTSQYRVNSDGNISMPLIQSTRVAGLTSQQIEEVLTTRLKAGYLRDPKVSVEVAEFRPFFILGEVRNAGRFPYVAGMTVQNAIAIGGGYTERGDQGPVLLTRKTAEGTVSEKVDVTTQMYPGDIIYVRERWF
ncbi:MAG: polysaccharide biosynthesis/export family protein [Pseudomonadota bacterium]